jgi:hypothetical protein
VKALRTALILAALAVLAAMPWFGSDVLVQFGINALLLAVLAQGWNIIGRLPKELLQRSRVALSRPKSMPRPAITCPISL